MQVEGQQEVEEDVRQLLAGIRRQAVLHHGQQELHKFCIQVFWKQQDKDCNPGGVNKAALARESLEESVREIVAPSLRV